MVKNNHRTDHLAHAKCQVKKELINYMYISPFGSGGGQFATTL